MKFLLLILFAWLIACEPTVSEYLDQCMTAPKTLRDMQQIAVDTSSALKEIGITHWLDWGTLLGAYRFAAPMPYDDDVDFGLLRNEYEAHKEELSQKLAEKGYDIEYRDADLNGSHIPAVLFKNNPNRPHLDLFLFEPMPGKSSYLKFSSYFWHQKTREVINEGMGFPRDVIFAADGSLHKIKLAGVEFNAPVNIEAYFARQYPDPNILTNFMITQNHGSGLCADRVTIKNIQKDRKSLNRMLLHLEKTFAQYNRSDSRLY